MLSFGGQYLAASNTEWNFAPKPFLGRAENELPRQLLAIHSCDYINILGNCVVVGEMKPLGTLYTWLAPGEESSFAHNGQSDCGVVIINMSNRPVHIRAEAFEPIIPFTKDDGLRNKMRLSNGEERLPEPIEQEDTGAVL